MTATLGANRYGKAEIRLATVERDGDWHELTDLTVGVALQGDFAAAHVQGDNRDVLPTDTMRATVYALARRQPVGEIEAFGLRLVDRFLEAAPAASSVEVALRQHEWRRLAGGSHPHAFTRDGPAVRTATVQGTRDNRAVTAGVADLAVLKTTGSAFRGFLVDELTVLPETDDRVLATTITADWDYTGTDVDFATSAGEVRRLLVDTFAEHHSLALQHTLYTMGEAVLAQRPEVSQVRFRLPNQHHLLADLSPYGLDNPGQVFVVSDRPYGVIEGTVRR